MTVAREEVKEKNNQKNTIKEEKLLPSSIGYVQHQFASILRSFATDVWVYTCVCVCVCMYLTVSLCGVSEEANRKRKDFQLYLYSLKF